MMMSLVSLFQIFFQSNDQKHQRTSSKVLVYIVLYILYHVFLLYGGLLVLVIAPLLLALGVSLPKEKTTLVG